jgi:hypothetical protein
MPSESSSLLQATGQILKVLGICAGYHLGTRFFASAATLYSCQTGVDLPTSALVDLEVKILIIDVGIGVVHLFRTTSQARV